MLSYSVLGSAIIVALITANLLSRKRSALPNPVSAEDVQEAFKQVAIKKSGLWVAFDYLAKRYGSIYSLNLRGNDVVVLNSAQLAWDLLEKRGEVYSSRPRLVTAHELLSGSVRGLSAPYGEHWRKWRKVQRVGLNSRTAQVYHDHQALESTIYLRDLYKDPGNYSEHSQRFAASVVLSISYGRRAASMQDRAVTYNVRSIKEFQRATVPGASIADSWPILLWLPRPLQWFRYEYDKIFKQDVEFYLSMVEDVRTRMAAGKQKECMTTRALNSKEDKLSDLELAYFVSTPFGAGVDTTAGSIEYAIVTAMLHPESTKKVQAELDQVVGRDRLPTFADQANLPYLAAWIKELERWRTVAPYGVPHASSRDDVVEGYLLPKGTAVYANIYSMMKDPDMFPEPELFRPERFLPTDGQVLDSHLRDFSLPFGFGRRQCPGMHIATQSLYIVISRLLWTFDVVLPHGAPAPDLSTEINFGLTRAPLPFQFSLNPRSADALKVLELETAEADMRLKDWE